MIASLTGTIVSKNPTQLVLDVQGVGYEVRIPLTTFETLPDAGGDVTIHTHMHVREDAIELYGFDTTASRSMFRTLLSVSGIGPRMALGILSKTGAVDLKRYIREGNPAGLTSLPGVGKKLADRLIVELRDKLSGPDPDERQGVSSTGGTSPDPRLEAVMALTSLGYSRQAAEKAVHTALQTHGKNDLTPEMIIKAALQLSQR